MTILLNSHRIFHIKGLYDFLIQFPVLFGGISIFIIGLAAIIIVFAIKAQKRRIVTGREGIIGEKGMTHSELHPQGTVIIRGEIWKAITTSADLAKNTPIIVEGISNLTLLVRPDSNNDTHIPTTA